jgi:N-acetylglutamate synthase-like GNAT family acetyltransferase
MVEFERSREEFRITTDRAAIDVDAVHAYLTRSYWSPGVPRAIVEKAIARSLCFALLHGTAQIGFARVITDAATFAYLCDVYVLEDYQSRGLGKWLIGEMLSHPELQGLRRFMLATKDAHGLYEHFSFERPKYPETILEILKPNIYTR